MLQIMNSEWPTIKKTNFTASKWFRPMRIEYYTTIPSYSMLFDVDRAGQGQDYVGVPPVWSGVKSVVRAVRTIPRLRWTVCGPRFQGKPCRAAASYESRFSCLSTFNQFGNLLCFKFFFGSSYRRKGCPKRT